MAATAVVLFCIQNKQTCFYDSVSVVRMLELVHTCIGIFKNICIYFFLSKHVRLPEIAQ